MILIIARPHLCQMFISGASKMERIKINCNYPLGEEFPLISDLELRGQEGIIRSFVYPYLVVLLDSGDLCPLLPEEVDYVD